MDSDEFNRRKVDNKLAQYNAELQQIASTIGEGQEEMLSQEILKRQRDLQANIREAESQKRLISMTKRERIDKLGRKLQKANTLAAPAIILLIAVILWSWRSLRKRHYISHKSDA